MNWLRHALLLTINEGKQSQTDRLSAFVVDRVKIFLFIILQNLLGVSHTMRMHEGLKNVGSLGPRSYWDGVC